MHVNEPQAPPHQAMLLNKKQDLIIFGFLHCRQRLEEI